MHIRISRHSRNGKSYDYAQLVESYRRASDGMPAHRVIATLGPPDSLEVENFRAALEAVRAGKRVAVVSLTRTTGARPPKPTANLRYLDLAVLLELWREWDLDAMLDDLIPQGQARLRPASVVTALVLQRCADPGSKLYASRWLPRTALPELLDLAPDGFNNTRLHRVLDDLDSATGSLMAKLPKRYQERDGAFASLFMDVTDTWFVGGGPPLAARAKTKDGVVQRKVGIVLLCNEHGYPMRWEVIAGRESEVVAMSRMLALVAGLSWAQQVPLVCDRAMGHTAQIREMLAAGLHFLTALTTPEYDAYTDRVPHQALAGLQPHEDSREQDLTEAARLIEAAGLQRVEDHLFVLDLGVVERVEEDTVDSPLPASEDESLVQVMQLARSIDEAVTAGRYASQASAARALGLSKQLASRYGILRRLPESVQQQILAGKGRGRSLDELIRIARLDDAQKQAEAFAALLATPPARRASARPLGVAHNSSAPATNPALEPIRVRAVVYFNPQLFIDQRLRARKQLEAVRAFADDLNTRLASPRSRMQHDQIAAAIDRQLRKDDLLEAFTPVITEQKVADRSRYHVELRLDEANWSRRHRYDGFNIVVAHPKLERSAAELCRLYRAKDAVEKDFKIIKSVVELRPVRHQTDAKVRAHVTLCMLALLIERTLRHRLQPLEQTAEAALESLAPCHLNYYAAADGAGLYSVTRLDPEQRAILKRLRLLHLADDDDLASKIRPRQTVVSTPKRETVGKQGIA